MPAIYTHQAPVSQGSILDVTPVNPGNSVTTSEFNNTDALQTFADLLVTVTASTTPTTSPYIVVRIIYSVDGSLYETISEALIIDEIPVANGTVRRFIKNLFILPFRFKLVFTNTSNVSCNVSVDLFTRGMLFNAI